MKTVVIGDLHGNPLWKKIVEKESADRVVFIGDYFDAYNLYTPVEQIHNFKEIMYYKTSSAHEVICLIGNHDYHYFSFIGNQYISGYQAGAAPQFAQVLDENLNNLRMAYRFDDFVFSHAGISRDFMRLHKEDDWSVASMVDDVNDLWVHKPLIFTHNGLEATGDHILSSPIWIRPRSLMRVNELIRKEIIQIVGHTRVNAIDIKGKSTGGRYYFIDAINSNNEYLIIQDGIISSGQI